MAVSRIAPHAVLEPTGTLEVANADGFRWATFFHLFRWVRRMLEATDSHIVLPVTLFSSTSDTSTIK